jgi:Rieske Fe-S protein
MPPSGVTRRTLTGAASLGLALPVLAACGGDEPEQATDPEPTADGPEAPESSDPATPDPDPSDGASGSSAPPGLLTAADVPVGGGVILAEEKLVVTQPTRGDFQGFTAVCTHQGCLVEAVTDTIDCRCHGSRFSIEDGSVVNGPASSPLGPRRLEVRGDAINLA